MNNDSNLSDFSSSGILALQPQIYEFSQKFPQKINTIRFHKSMTVRIGPIRDQTNWRPKLPSKKLFEDPKFLLSIERKKVRVINGLRQSEFQMPEMQRNQFKSDRIKTKREQPKNRKSPHSGDYPQQYSHSGLHKTSQTKKIPLVNFNLQHLIKQRKSFKSQESNRKKGNNDPYYSFFSSDRFEASQAHERGEGTGRGNRKSSVSTARANRTSVSMCK